jgi:hypothetical protein
MLEKAVSVETESRCSFGKLPGRRLVFPDDKGNITEFFSQSTGMGNSFSMPFLRWDGEEGRPWLVSEFEVSSSRWI